MFEIKVTVDIPGLPEAITALAAAMAGAPRADAVDAKKGGRTRSPKKDAPTEEPKNEPAAVAPEVNPTPADAIPTAPASVPTAPCPTNAPTGAIEATPTTAAPTPAPVAPPAAPVAAPPTKTLTMNDIATAGAQLIDKGKMGQLLELLKKYSVQAVTQLKESDYPAFAADLRTLGAAI